MIAWMGLAMMVSTRLWVAGVVQLSRDRSLADRLMVQVRRAAKPCDAARLTDGWAAYPNSIRRAFREKIKQTVEWGERVAGLARDAHWHGDQADGEKAGRRDHEKDDPWPVGASREAAAASHGGSSLNTAFIERLNGLPGTVGQLDAQIPRCSSPPSA